MTRTASVAIGFDGCVVERYDGVLAVSGDVRVRHFPLRVTDSLALVVNRGREQTIVAGGKPVRVPANATIFRPPNEIWSIAEARFGFECINIDQRLLPRGTQYETFSWRPPTSLVANAIAALRSSASRPGHTLAGVIEALFEAGLARSGERFSGELNRARRAREFIETHFASDPDLDEIAAAADLDRFALVRLFRRAYGITPHAFQIRLRIREAERLLARGHGLDQVAAEVGFADLSHLTRHFRRIVGMPPGAFRNLQFRSTARPGRAVFVRDGIRIGSNHHE